MESGANDKPEIITEKIFNLDEKLNFPKIYDFSSLLSNLHTVISKTMNRPKTVDLKNYNYKVPTSFKNKQFFLEFKYNNDQMKINIILPTEDQDYSPCLESSIDSDIHGKLVFVRSLGDYCKSFGGKYLLTLHHKLMCYFGINKLYLDDDAEVPCIITKNQKDINSNIKIKLFMIKVFKGEYNSWYKNFGYVPDISGYQQRKNFYDNKNYTINTYYDDMRYIHDFPINKVCEFSGKDIAELYDSFDTVQNDVWQMLESAAEFGQLAKETCDSNQAFAIKYPLLGPFMTALYNKKTLESCQNFNNIYNFIRKLGEIVNKNLDVTKTIVTSNFFNLPILELGYRFIRVTIVNMKQINNLNCNLEFDHQDTSIKNM